MPENSNYHRGRIFQNRAELRVLVEAETLQKLRERIEDSTLHVSQSGLFNENGGWGRDSAAFRQGEG